MPSPPRRAEAVSLSGSGFAATHTYADPGFDPLGKFAITATLQDDDSGIASRVAAFTGATIAGVKFRDVNKDGAKATTDNPMNGWIIYLDDDNDGVRDSGERYAVTTAGRSVAAGGASRRTCRNLYGATAGANNLTGKTNAQVAAYYITLFKVSGQKLAAQVLATAFAAYATDSDLAGTAARAYGFEVTTGGTGEARFNVGSSGEAFGVANRTTLSIREILDATNRLSANGVIYVNSRLRTPANDVYDCINNTGDI